ncbi:MAG: hypothetical protein ACPHQP_00360, partial [Longimicrobiales bacterium]
IVLPGGPVIGGRPVSTALGMSAKSLDPDEPLSTRLERRIREMGASPGRLSLASVVRAGEVLGDALAENRTLGREDRTLLGTLSIVVLGVGGVALLIPAVVGFMVALLAIWFGVTTGVRAWVQAMRARSEERQAKQHQIESEVSES